MNLINTRCAICGSFNDYKVIYKESFNLSDLNTDVFSARRMPDRVHFQIVKCNKDNLIRSNPALAESFLYILYKKSRFTYKEETGNLTTTYLTALKPILENLPKEAKILEIGCGNGFLLTALYNMGYKNVYGVELSVDAAEKSDKIIRDKITVDILRSDTFESSTFNLICFFQLLDHIPDPDYFLKICYNLLLPGGVILVFTHNVESLQSKILRGESPIIDIEHLYLYSKKTIKIIFEKNNFLPIKIYSPVNTVSLKYMVWLFPLPKLLKIKLLSLKSGIFYYLLRQKIKIKLGNICLIATKGTA